MVLLTLSLSRDPWWAQLLEGSSGPCRGWRAEACPAGAQGGAFTVPSWGERLTRAAQEGEWVAHCLEGPGLDLCQPEQAQPRQGSERLGKGRGSEVETAGSGESSRGGDPSYCLDICPRTSSEAASASCCQGRGSAWKGRCLGLRGNESLAERSPWNACIPTDTHVGPRWTPTC